MRSVWVTILLGLIVFGCRSQDDAKPEPSPRTTPRVDQPTTPEKPANDIEPEPLEPEPLEPTNREPQPVVLTNDDGVPCDSLGMPLVFEYELPEVPEHLVGPTLETPNT